METCYAHHTSSGPSKAIYVLKSLHSLSANFIHGLKNTNPGHHKNTWCWVRKF